ncbi:MAG: hydroxymethylglutaryl-CoA reductase, degradative [Candidatus Micrarchaeota archaeon]
MSNFSGFYKLSLEQRLAILKKELSLSDDELILLKNSGSLSLESANTMIENTIGAIHLPLGLAMNFKINGTEKIIPMAIEEPSVIAGASKAAKLCLPDGFTASADPSIMIGQIQLVNVKNPKKAIETLNAKRDEILVLAKKLTESLTKYGGGVQNFKMKLIETNRGEMIIVYFYVNVADAMGANTINTFLEKISPTIAEYTQSEVRLRILSNLATKRMVRAKAVWKKEIIGEETIEKFLDAYEFALNDVYRCATHNKGIMNGIDAVVLATGNDWRAVEAGAHAYAATKEQRKGYTSLTHYEKDEYGDLVGSIELPLAIATVGGAINTLPTAKLALKILGAKSSQDLAMAIACAGLANNFAAMYALSTTGIQEGHMKLHARKNEIKG